MTRITNARVSQVFLVALWLAADGSLAYGQSSTTDPLSPALAAIDEVDYASAAEQLDTLLSGGGLTARDRIRALELLGACRVYLGERAAGLRAFREALSRDPDWVLPSSYPPRVRSAFDEAVLGAPPVVEVRLEEMAGADVDDPETAVVIRVVSGADAVARLWLITQSRDGSEVRVAFLRRSDVYVARLRTVGARARTIPYRCLAAAPSGAQLASLTGERRVGPLTGSITADTAQGTSTVGNEADGEGADAETGTPWYASWWFWTAVVVAAAAGTTAGLLLASPDGPRDGVEGNWAVWQ